MAKINHVILCGGTSIPRTTKSDEILRLDLAGEDANVALEIFDISRRLLTDVPDVLTDLIEIASYVYCADQAVTRGGEGVREFGNNWRRRFSFHVPVRQQHVWSSPAILDSLQSTLSSLSEDEYNFHFTGRINAVPLQRYLKFTDVHSTASEIDEVLLFSGGLDSLGGAVQEAVHHRKRTALVSHRSNPKISSRQARLVDNLRALCDRNPPLHIPVWVHKRGYSGPEYSQRSRSFLYASLALIVARVFGLNRIRFYENGVVSLNLPISEQAVGTRATRTTRPDVLSGFERLFTLLIDQPFTVENPFLWHTRAEIVNVIGDAGCAELIQNSVSCMHTYEQTNEKSHCGRCSQCIGRRFATLASRYTEKDPEHIYKVDLLKGEREADKDLTLVESFIRTARDMKQMGDLEVIARYGEVSRVLRHVPGMSADQVAIEILALHRKHALEVTQVMDSALSANSTELLEGRLPASCAIALSVPEKYKTVRLRTPPNAPARENVASERGGPGNSRSRYSKNDHKVYELISETKLRNLTNDNIHRQYKAQISKLLKKQLSPNALRACLNRIRRHWQLPLSEEISKKSIIP